MRRLWKTILHQKNKKKTLTRETFTDNVDVGKKLFSAPVAPLEDRFGDLVGLDNPNNLSSYITSWDRTVAADWVGIGGTRIPMAHESSYLKVDGLTYNKSSELGVPADFTGGGDSSYTYTETNFQKANDPPNQGIPRYDIPLERTAEQAPIMHIDGDIYSLASQEQNVKETYSANPDRQRRIEAVRPYEASSSSNNRAAGGSVYINSGPAYPWFTQFGSDNYAQGLATNPYFSPYSFPYPYTSNPNLQPWGYPNLNPYPYSFVDSGASSPYFPSRYSSALAYPPLTELVVAEEARPPPPTVSPLSRKLTKKRQRPNSMVGWGLGVIALVMLFVLLVVAAFTRNPSSSICPNKSQ